MSKQSNENIAYDFKAEDMQNYSLKFNLEAKSRLFKLILRGALTKLKRANRPVNKDVIENQKTFKAPPEFLSIIHTAINEAINNVAEQIQDDNILILTSSVQEAIFTENQESKIWNVDIIVGGNYCYKKT